MKRCNLCLIAKPFEAFRRRKDSADGLSHRCKDCLKIAEDAWRHRNKERANSSRKAWAKNNPEKRKATLERYFEENQEKERLRAVEYRAKNRLKTNAAAANWSRNNPGTRNAITARRRAAKLLRTPKWLTDADYLEMRLIYEFAQCVEIATGIPHHVDHIIPLQGELVSGLHVPANLQILPSSENCAKSNRWEVDTGVT